MKSVMAFTSVLLSVAVAQAAAPARQAAAQSAPAKAAASAPAAKPQLQQVTYEELGKYLNQRVVVRTTLRTERSGSLVKYSNTAIELKLDSGATLGLPRETIRTIGVPIAPPDPLFQNVSDGSAKKN